MSTDTTTPPPALVSAEDAAKLLTISEAHFYNMQRAGKLGPQPIRLGRAVRWRRAELVEWMDAGCPDRAAWTAGREVKA